MKNRLKTLVLIGLLALTLNGCQPITNTGAGMGAAAAMALRTLAGVLMINAQGLATTKSVIAR